MLKLVDEIKAALAEQSGGIGDLGMAPRGPLTSGKKKKRMIVTGNPVVEAKDLWAPTKEAKKRMTSQQKKALADYRFAVQQEYRYLGSVFVTPFGQRSREALTKTAYDRCKSLGMGVEHGL